MQPYNYFWATGSTKTEVIRLRTKARRGAVSKRAHHSPRTNELLYTCRNNVRGKCVTADGTHPFVALALGKTSARQRTCDTNKIMQNTVRAGFLWGEGVGHVTPAASTHRLKLT
jgi:hypothetical protein